VKSFASARRRGLTAAAVGSAVAVSVLLAGPAQAAANGTTELLDKPPSGAAPDGPSSSPSITPDGRYVAFASRASNLTSTPNSDGSSDVFVRDTRTGVTKQISVGLDGAEANGDSFQPDITPDGRYVVFTSGASNLVTDDQDPDVWVQEVFLKDLKTGRITRIFTGTHGEPNYGADYGPTISDDGGTIAFDSSQTDLVPGDTNQVRDVFVWKRSTGKITRVSVSSSGAQGGSATTPNRNADSRDAEISGDGRTVVFRSGADNLVTGDTNGISDIFLHSLTTHRTTRISVGPNGEQATPTGTSSEGADFPSISADGRIVAYIGYQLKGIVAEDTGNSYQIYVYNRATGRTQLGVRSADGDLVNDAVAAPTLSPDGRFLGFETSAQGVVKEDTDRVTDAFVRDLRKGRTARVSVTVTGEPANGWTGSGNLALSSGGQKVAFTSDATNLVSDPVSGNNDLYLRTFVKGFWND
jgi:Tol biopolymer transport system component